MEVEGKLADSAARRLSDPGDEPEAPNTPYEAYRVAGSAGSTAVSAFVRDPVASRQVWSRQEGYPGDEWYLEFHKIRGPGGLRYWRVSAPGSDLGAKEPYRPDHAIERAGAHGRHFASLLGRLVPNSPRSRAVLLGCGVAPGMASAYKAPIAGAIFVMEVVLGNFAMDVLAPIVVASVISTLITLAAFGRDPLYGYGLLELTEPSLVLSAAVPRGNVYGTEKSFRQTGPFSFSKKSEIENLFLCGASILSHGVAGASRSGVETAAAILKCNGDDLLVNTNGQDIRIYDAEDNSQWPAWIHQKMEEKAKRFKKVGVQGNVVL